MRLVSVGRVLMLLTPSLLFIALYLPSLDHGFVWTDQGEIEHGILIQPRGQLLAALAQPMHPDLDSLSPGAEQPYYRPLQVIVVSLLDAEYGRRPWVFRSATIALGAISIAIFSALACWLFRDPLLGALAAALVAAHPVGIEMYVWIAGMSGALAHLGILLSLLTAALALSSPAKGARWTLAALSLLALGLGLLSKESAVVTPALLAGLCFCHFAPARTAKAREVDRGFALGLLSAQTIATLVFALGWRPHVLGESLAGAPPIEDSLAVHVFTSLASWPERLGWLFAPIQSSTSDVVRIAHSLADPIALLGLLLALISPLIAWRLVRQGLPVAALGLAWLWIAFLPTSGLIPLTHMRAERYLALSAFGAALLVASLLPAVARSVVPRHRSVALAVMGLGLVIGLAGRSAVRIPDWESNLVLFERDVNRDPLFREGYYILASTLADQGRFEDAAHSLAQLRALGPRFVGLSSFLRTADALVLQCRVNRMLGEDAATVELLGDELRANSEDLAAQPQLFLCGARALTSVGRFEEAFAIALRIRDLHPGAIDPGAALLAVRAQIGMGRIAAAARELTAIPANALRSPELDTELRQLKALLREQRKPGAR